MIEPSSSVVDPVVKKKKNKKYHPKPWWWYRDQKRRQKKLQEQGLADSNAVEAPPVAAATEKSKKKRKPRKKRNRAARKQQKDDNDDYPFPPDIPKPPSYSSNSPKDDIPLYRDDADITVVDVKGRVPLRCNTWDEMNLDAQLLANLKARHFTWPRKVQEAVIPYIAEGYDIKCQSETGTGKTAAYLIPIIDNLIKQKERDGSLPFEGPICVILAPTREIVRQIYQDAQSLAYKTGISVAKAYGEIRLKDNLEELTNGCNILCACIGRLMNLMKHDHDEWEELLMLDLKYLVIDEADHFMTGPETYHIKEFLEHERLPPAKTRQNLFFSPTLRIKKLDLLADKHCNVKKTVLLTSSFECNQRIQFFVENVPSQSQKFEYLLNRVRKIVEEYKSQSPENKDEYPRIMIFTNTKGSADTVALDLTNAKFPAVAIHSSYHQSRRDRIMAQFRKEKSSKCRILVSVNVVGRGIDIPEMDYVINYEIPDSHDSKYRFIQRCGRTGRSRSGTAYTFYVEAKDKNLAKGVKEVIQNAQGKAPQFLDGRFWTSEIEESMEKLVI